MEIVSKLLRTLTKVFSDANLFSNLVTIDLLSELYLMVPLLLLVTNSNRLIRYWITATGAGAFLYSAAARGTAVLSAVISYSCTRYSTLITLQLDRVDQLLYITVSTYGAE